MSLFLSILSFLVIAFVLGYALKQAHLLSLFIRRRKNRPSNSVNFSEDFVPKVTIQLPIYNEMYVVERVIDDITLIDYPKDKLEIQVLDDSTDKTKELAQTKVNYYLKQGFNIKYIHRDDRFEYKAGALNEGLKIAEGEFVALFDADFLPGKDFLKKAIPHFKNEKIGTVQARWGHINKEFSEFTRVQADFLDLHFVVEQVGLNIGGYFNRFDGTAGIWRKKCIMESGGWSGSTLIEDMDLSYRSQLKGWKFIYLENVVAPAELPVALNALRSQYFRWAKGSVQNAKKNLFMILCSNRKIGVKVHAFFTMLEGFVFPCLLFMQLFLSFFILHNNDYKYSVYLILISVCFCLVVLYSFVCLERGNATHKFYRTIRVFILVSGFSLSNSYACFQGLIGKKSPFVRTPKFNVTSDHQRKKNVYLAKQINFISVLEVVLLVYCLASALIMLCDMNILAFIIYLLFSGSYLFMIYYAVKDQIYHRLLSK